MITVSIAGSESGSTVFTNAPSTVQPSTIAASSISRGTDLKNPIEPAASSQTSRRMSGRETPGRAKTARGAAVAPLGYGKTGGLFVAVGQSVRRAARATKEL